MNISLYLGVLFGLTTLATLFLFNRAITNSTDGLTVRKFGLILGLQLLWLALQGTLAIFGKYSTHLEAMPPKFLVFGTLPPLVVILLLFVTPKGRRFVDSLPLKSITYINTVRIAVELILFLLYVQKAVPKLMTFEGGNLDILSGLTAPVIAYFAFTRRVLDRGWVLVWNFLCLGLLFNIVVRAILSAPLPMQRLAFDQPNIAILHFPYVWLPTFIVPVVLFGHVVSIRRLLKRKD